jgi:hypothetical protein
MNDPTLSGSGLESTDGTLGLAVNGSKKANAQDRQFLTANPGRGQASNESDDRHGEERAAVAFHFDSKLGEMGSQRSDHQTQGQGRP